MSQRELKSRLLFHTLGKDGLGHLNRQVTLARAIREICPSTDILFASESAYGPVLAPEFPFINLPSTRQLNSAAWLKADAGPEPGSDSLVSTLLAIVEALLTTYRPGAVIHDTLIWPPLFEAAARIGTKQAIVLRIRRDLRTFLAPSSPAMRSNLLILPYTPQEATPILEALPGNSPPAICVGHIVRLPALPSHEARTRLGIAADVPLIVLTGGGGGSGEISQFYQLALDALRLAVSEFTNYLVVLVLGPAYTSAPPITNHINIQVWPALPWLPDLIAASDLIICQAGYNTLAEVESACVPAIVVPGDRITDDQAARAKAYGELNPHFHVFEGTDLQGLANVIVDAMSVHSYISSRRPAVERRYAGLSEGDLIRVAMLGEISKDEPAIRGIRSADISNYF